MLLGLGLASCVTTSPEALRVSAQCTSVQDVIRTHLAGDFTSPVIGGTFSRDYVLTGEQIETLVIVHNTCAALALDKISGKEFLEILVQRGDVAFAQALGGAAIAASPSGVVNLLNELSARIAARGSRSRAP